MKIPKEIIKIASDCSHLGGRISKIGRIKNADIYTYVYPEEMTIGIHDVYLWDGRKAVKKSGN